MDIKKLETLSCLRVNEDNKKVIENSINDVWKMIEEIKLVDIDSKKDNVEKENAVTIFKNREDIFFNIDEKTDGIKNEDGLFKTTRVVHKKG